MLLTAASTAVSTVLISYVLAPIAEKRHRLIRLLERS